MSVGEVVDSGVDVFHILLVSAHEVQTALLDKLSVGDQYCTLSKYCVVYYYISCTLIHCCVIL